MSRLGIILLVVVLVSLTNATLVGQYAVRQAYRLRGGNPVIGRPYSLSDQVSAASFTVQYPQVPLCMQVVEHLLTSAA